MTVQRVTTRLILDRESLLVHLLTGADELAGFFGAGAAKDFEEFVFGLVVTDEEVFDLLPPQQGELTKEDGERVIDEQGRRIATAIGATGASELSFIRLPNASTFNGRHSADRL